MKLANFQHIISVGGCYITEDQDDRTQTTCFNPDIYRGVIVSSKRGYALAWHRNPVNQKTPILEAGPASPSTSCSPPDGCNAGSPASKSDLLIAGVSGPDRTRQDKTRQDKRGGETTTPTVEEEGDPGQKKPFGGSKGDLPYFQGHEKHRSTYGGLSEMV